ncbi:class II aldolase/adducin family protein [Pseudomonas spirodelae]|uniref:Class II aldolase/adducin family protein n=1 Tax=Pseudomonas spirodelae TaxID=3101751 RepID=A0ABU5PBS8_9PSED|nr:class II aldolase/adducin family protein [Pseudomonas sp. T5W1]MBU0807923.1 class II aldolase/adducin family protein [Gammaproteobacteria bacterium]MBU0882232.1 class II aldolase/adducin family protein [Gammaproteobacteria bacterium]MBU0903460.1 class II aldolase/adducin family protein [Gammaproteobacteria bacterium]MBU1859463.1 class II aldolase/adducin family protein [Gammaproteobacteria bacterium]MEA1606975.1 class II aldolase/adducin family protein [Pseudomonas sp. T5W1]
MTVAHALPAVSLKDQVSAAEWQTRVDLAACYRLIALHGWDDLIFTHISAKIPGSEEFLINPFGLMFHEITASSLVKIDLAGNKLMDSPFDINPAGYTIHSAVHEVRHDVACVVHIHTAAGIAVSAQKQGLLPLSQQSLFVLSSLAYHGYEGVALNHDEKARLQADLGDKNFMILPNHGLLTASNSIADTFLMMFTLQRACEIQVMAQSGGAELIHIPQQILNGAKAMVAGVMKSAQGMGGSLAWPALLRKLDQQMPGYDA